MLSHDLIVAPTQSRPPAIIDGSGRKARDRIEHFLRAAIDNDNTRKAYGRALGSFFAFLEDGGRERVQDIGPLDVRDYLEAAKTNGLSTATLKQHMAAIRMLFDHLVTGAVLENGGTLEKARQMAAHASTRTTQLYDRREDRVTLDEVVKINIRG
jgi:site-specific recombinase XerD